MKTVSNKLQKPVSIPLPRGKVLHLGPGKSGQIAAGAAEYPPLKKLLEAGQIDVVDGAPGGAAGSGSGGPRAHAAHGVGWGSGKRRSGDR